MCKLAAMDRSCVQNRCFPFHPGRSFATEMPLSVPPGQLTSSTSRGIALRFFVVPDLSDRSIHYDRQAYRLPDRTKSKFGVSEACPINTRIPALCLCARAGCTWPIMSSSMSPLVHPAPSLDSTFGAVLIGTFVGLTLVSRV